MTFSSGLTGEREPEPSLCPPTSSIPKFFALMIIASRKKPVLSEAVSEVEGYPGFRIKVDKSKN